MRCPECSESPSALDFVSHVERVHFGHGAFRWSCQECRYQSHSFNDAVAHSIVLDHDPKALRMDTPDEILEIAKRAVVLRSNRAYSTNSTDSRAIYERPTPMFESVSVPILPYSAANITAYQSPPPKSPEYISPPPFVFSENLTPKRSRKRVRKQSTPKPETLQPTFPDMPDQIDQVEEEASEEEDPMQIVPEEDDNEKSKETFIECRHCLSSVRITQGHRASMITQHVTKCLKIQPYSCTLCPYKSTRKTHVTAHVKRHHPAAQPDSTNTILPNQ